MQVVPAILHAFKYMCVQAPKNIQATKMCEQTWWSHTREVIVATMAEETSSDDENGQGKEKGSEDQGQGAKNESQVMQQVKHVCPEEIQSVEEALVSLLKRDATFTFGTSQSER
jgi:hypothetical protein